MDNEERARLKRREAKRRAMKRRQRRQQILLITFAVLLVAAVGALLYLVIIRPNAKQDDPKQSESAPATSQSVPIPSVSITEADPAQSQESAVPVSTEEAVTDPVESMPVQTVIPQTPDANNGILVDSHQYDVSGLSNASISFGCADEYDELGRATGLYYYELLYGKFGQVYYIHTNDKVVYLTMDEGYEAGFTPQILDTLKEKNVHAVFFITNQFLTEKPEYVQRMIDEGHIIGNHTCRHPSGGYPKYVDAHGLDSFTEDLSRLHKAVYDQFGYTMKLFRFPEGESSDMTVAQAANLGYTSVFWSFTQYDFDTENQPDPVKTLAEDVERAAPGVIFLLHACSATNTQILGDFIDQVRARGYEFGIFPGY